MRRTALQLYYPLRWTLDKDKTRRTLTCGCTPQRGATDKVEFEPCALHSESVSMYRALVTIANLATRAKQATGLAGRYPTWNTLSASLGRKVWRSSWLR